MTIQTLPKILRITGRIDGGEANSEICPHCGAEGRYITTFVLENGHEAGAMSGCLKLFPKSEYAAIYSKAIAKKKPSRWDTDIMTGIDKYGRGELSKEQLDNGLRAISMERMTWRKRMGYA